MTDRRDYRFYEEPGDQGRDGVLKDWFEEHGFRLKIWGHAAARREFWNKTKSFKGHFQISYQMEGIEEDYRSEHSLMTLGDGTLADTVVSGTEPLFAAIREEFETGLEAEPWTQITASMFGSWDAGVPIDMISGTLTVGAIQDAWTRVQRNHGRPDVDFVPYSYRTPIVTVPKNHILLSGVLDGL